MASLQNAICEVCKGRSISPVCESCARYQAMPTAELDQHRVGYWRLHRFAVQDGFPNLSMEYGRMAALLERLYQERGGSL